MRRAFAVVLVVLVLPGAHARAWQVRPVGSGAGPGEALAAAVTAGGDVIAGGYLDQDGTGPAFTVIRLAAADGAERWRTLLPGSGAAGSPDRVNALVLDPTGAVIAAGTSTAPGPVQQFTVVKLSASTGAVQWRYDAPTQFGQALAVAADDAGHVIAAGFVRVDPLPPVFTVVKLMGETGEPAWTAQLEPTYHGLSVAAVAALAVRPDGDVVAAGHTGSGVNRVPDPVVVRLDRTTGAEIWRASSGGSCGEHLAVAPAGDVFVSGSRCLLAVPGTVQTLRLSGEAGTEVWSRSTPPVDALGLDGDGNPTIVATDIGFTFRFPAPVGFRAMRLARESGTVLADHAFTGERNCDTYLCAPFGDGQGGAVTPAGDVLVAGALGHLDDRFVTARLTGPDLHEAWRRNDPFWHAVPGRFAARAAILAPADRLVLPGAVTLESPASTSPVFSVLSLSAVDGALDACGDAVRDAGERCDDGLVESGCCGPDCAAAIPDGTACDDFDACSIGDVCTDATCRGTAPLPCAPCGTCNSRNGCVPDIAYECEGPTATNAAMVVIEQDARGRRRLAWQMRSGPATAVTDFGNPIDTTDYAVCAYANGKLLARAVAPAGPCGAGRRCWKRTRRGFAYRNPRAPDGISKLSLRAGAAGRTRLRVSARGPHLLAPALPVEEAGVLVQLRRGDDGAACWYADHTVVVKNRTDLFRATGD
jgi:outer membrane protein assembly factor BamB